MPSPMHPRARAAACPPRCSSRWPTSVLLLTCRDRSRLLRFCRGLVGPFVRLTPLAPRRRRFPRRLRAGCLAGLRCWTPGKHRLGPVDLVVGDDALGLGRVVEPDRCRGLVGGHQRALQAALAALAFRGDDVAQSQRHRLADGASEVVRCPQAAFEPWAGDLERVVTGHRVVVVELAADQARRQGEGLEVETLLRTRRTVDGDAQRAATKLEVVQLQVQIGDDGYDQPLDLAQCGAVAHLVSLLPGLAWFCLGLSVKKAWTPRSPRLQFIELQRTHRVYRLAGSLSPRPPPP